MVIIPDENMMASVVKKNKVQQQKIFTLSLTPVSSHLCKATVSINPKIAQSIYEQTVKLFRQKDFYGLNRAIITVDYVEEHAKNEMIKKVRQYFFKHFVLGFLTNEIIDKKINISNAPRLTRVDGAIDNMQFVFDLALADPLEIKEWRNFSFSAPKRKRYKDLDKQVENFIAEELNHAKLLNKDQVDQNDWVYFQATLLGDDMLPFNSQLTSSMWINITSEDVVDTYKNIFLNKKNEETFITNQLDLDDSLNDYDDNRYNFQIKVNSIYKGKRLSLDHLKATFKLKNKLDIHNKLMEIFSYRDDQSQRKAIIEELFHLLLSKHRFEVPKHVIFRRQEDIMLTLMNQSDFQVYKAQKGFHQYLEQLAEKQLKEEIIIDQIAYKENIAIDPLDMQNYIHLFNNKRLHEFIYFKPYAHRLETAGTLIDAGVFSQTVLREKTLNHIIHEISR